jgi:Mor family transcriptional regulator
MDKLLNDLTIEMIPEGLYRQIAELIGIENLARLAELIGGTTFYLPKLESFMKPARDAHIKAEYNGYNHVELAKRYGVTDRWVRMLCGEGICQNQLCLTGYTGEEVNNS